MSGSSSAAYIKASELTTSETIVDVARRRRVGGRLLCIPYGSLKEIHRRAAPFGRLAAWQSTCLSRRVERGCDGDEW